MVRVASSPRNARDSPRQQVGGRVVTGVTLPEILERVRAAEK
jgi:hypothetical protein